MPGIEKTAVWRALRARRAARRRIPLRRLFAENPRRFGEFSLCLDDLLLDFSKTALDGETAELLCQLAEAAGVGEQRAAMFSGAPVNKSENRAALHVALRAADGEIFCGGKNIMPAVIAARKDMLNYAEACRGGRIVAADGAPFTDVLHIGIGGAMLGAKTAAAALRDFCGGLRLRFADNIDGAALADALSELDARRTLVVVSSKSFATAETCQNARRAARWLAAAIGAENVARHLAAATAAPKKARQFGAGRIFAFEHWTGGRYSVWGAAGLPLALAAGKKHFLDFLAGARCMDEHFLSAPPRQNLPLMLGMLGIWHRNICRYPTRAVLPYARRLRFLPAYLQQLDMESNGKQTGADGGALKTETAPVVWGAEGTCAQHSFFQMLHQGTDIAPCEFILAARGKNSDAEQRRLLAANCLAQSAALMSGAHATESHRRFVGGRPSITILFGEITPFSLGRLLALFEHRAFVEGAVWGVNSFDQWGVELGKTWAAKLSEQFGGDAADEDSSTRGLLAHCKKLMDG